MLMNRMEGGATLGPYAAPAVVPVCARAAETPAAFIV